MLSSPAALVQSQNYLEKVQQLFSPNAASAAVQKDRVLIVSANPNQQLTIVATAGPRGMDPLIARTARELNAALAENQGRVRLAVLDGSIDNSATLAELVRRALPADCILIVAPGSPPEKLGRRLLERM
jgi:hypothetical protein